MNPLDSHHSGLPGGDRPTALAGLRVLELADEKGAYCGKLLAQMGADVIKVETPCGCSTRSIPPFWRDEPHPDNSLFFLYMNTDKRSVTLDIAKEEGQGLFRQLARTADVVVETLAPGHVGRLRLGYEALRESNPGLIMTSITGFGQTGPQKDYKSCDLVTQAVGGAMDSMRTIALEGDPPVKLGSGQANIVASVHGAAATSIALFYRRRTGQGQHIDISMEEAMVSVNHIRAGRKARFVGGNATQNDRALQPLLHHRKGPGVRPAGVKSRASGQPPYYGCQIWPGGVVTRGGPRRNARAEILNLAGEPIAGLYGADELGGVTGLLYPSPGSALSECIAFGRVAGESLARTAPRSIEPRFAGVTP